MFIQRDYKRTIDDDWKLNVQPLLNSVATNTEKESVEVYHEGKIVGWNIQNQYE